MAANQMQYPAADWARLPGASIDKLAQWTRELGGAKPSSRARWGGAKVRAAVATHATHIAVWWWWWWAQARLASAFGVGAIRFGAPAPARGRRWRQAGGPAASEASPRLVCVGWTRPTG